MKTTTQVKTRPIPFNDEMIRAIRAGTKTQTRRVVKPQPISDRVGMVNAGYCGDPNLWLVEGAVSEYTCHGKRPPQWRCPYGQPGDQLWVRERCATYDKGRAVVHAADVSKESWDVLSPELYKKRPAIHMPRWASRITLEIVSVRVERVQDISPEDAAAEGLRLDACDAYIRSQMSEPERRENNINLFRLLWTSVNSPASWEANPWVWVISFKRINGGRQ